jgi:hypothetical protein
MRRFLLVLSFFQSKDPSCPAGAPTVDIESVGSMREFS